MGLIKKIFGILITIVVIIIVLSIVGGTGLFIWGNHDEKNRYIKVETNVGYLIDKNDSMSAAQYKKDYPKTEPLYARVEVKTNRGSTFDRNEIYVTYRFSKKGNVGVSVAESNGTVIEKTVNSNVVEFTKSINVADRESKDTIIFRYSPSDDSENIKIEVIYSDPVKQTYNKSDTIYFK